MDSVTSGLLVTAGLLVATGLVFASGLLVAASQVQGSSPGSGPSDTLTPVQQKLQRNYQSRQQARGTAAERHRLMAASEASAASVNSWPP